MSVDNAAKTPSDIKARFLALADQLDEAGVQFKAAWDEDVAKTPGVARRWHGFINIGGDTYRNVPPIAQIEYEDMSMLFRLGAMVADMFMPKSLSEV